MQYVLAFDSEDGELVEAWKLLGASHDDGPYITNSLRAAEDMAERARRQFCRPIWLLKLAPVAVYREPSVKLKLGSPEL